MTDNIRMISTLDDSGAVSLHLASSERPEPGEGEVVVAIEAAPINPSDLGVMFGMANLSKATTKGQGADTRLELPAPDAVAMRFAGRVGHPTPVGNEGAGRVVAVGKGDAAAALDGKLVAIMGGGSYSRYVKVPAAMCLPLADDATAKDGASSFVNPLTALAMTEEMKLIGHSALVHTAAASNLGQMLVRICKADGIGLVNIVRSAEQADMLKKLGATHVCDSSADDFHDRLTDAIAQTGATLAFDAVGGGGLADAILMTMEAAQLRTNEGYSIYGSTTLKQVYLYGSLDFGATKLTRGYGMAWSVGGFLLPNFLAKAGAEIGQRMRQRVADELKTTFASHYTEELTLAEALDADTARRYNRKATGEKFLIRPNKEL